MNVISGLRCAAFVFALSACAGTPFRWEDAAKIQEGMTEAEVVAILGKPYSRSQSGAHSTLVWSYATGFGGGGKAVAYRFVNGRMAGSSTVGR